MVINDKIVVYRTLFFCDECKSQMIFVGMLLGHKVPMHEYRCSGCGRKESSSIKYPVTSVEKPAENGGKIVAELKKIIADDYGSDIDNSEWITELQEVISRIQAGVYK